MFPILYQNHDLIIYSYPLLMGLGWGVGYQIFFHKALIDRKWGQILFWSIFFFAWIGSKLFFLLNSHPDHKNLIQEWSFWTGGGFVFYGGIISVLALLTFWKTLKLPLNLQTIWALLLALIFGHGIGRLGCLLAGCCYGSPTDWWWAIDLHGDHRHPTQLIEALGLLGFGSFLWKKQPTVILIAFYFVFYGVMRFMTEMLRGDEIRGVWGPLTPSQWISLLFISIGILTTKFSYPLKPRGK
jgi:phosphatidylglycerol:prolipoprotein diacylglycerol transferase